MTRAGLHNKRGPAELPSRSQRHCQGPVEGDQACEVEWQSGQSMSRRREAQSREEVGQGGVNIPPPYAQARASLPPQPSTMLSC